MAQCCGSVCSWWEEWEKTCVCCGEKKKLLKPPQETKSSGIPNMSTLCLRCSPDKAGGFRFTTITLSKRVFFLARRSEAWKLPMSIASAGQNLEIHFFPQDWEEGIIHIPKQKKES